jgi:hypothetical protein
MEIIPLRSPTQSETQSEKEGRSELAEWGPHCMVLPSCLPMPHTQRTIWNDNPERLPDIFRLAKQSRSGETLTAVCELWTHAFGWELRLQIDGRGLQMSSVAALRWGDDENGRPLARGDDREGLDRMNESRCQGFLTSGAAVRACRVQPVNLLMRVPRCRPIANRSSRRTTTDAEVAATDPD